MSQKTYKPISKKQFILTKADSLANASWLWLIFPLIGPILGNMSISKLQEVYLEEYTEEDAEIAEKIKQKARLSIILSITFMVCATIVSLYYFSQAQSAINTNINNIKSYSSYE